VHKYEQSVFVGVFECGFIPWAGYWVLVVALNRSGYSCTTFAMLRLALESRRAAWELETTILTPHRFMVRIMSSGDGLGKYMPW
jgi:hypothetical protein